jgi:Tol biopolymer transport system component
LQTNGKTDVLNLKRDSLISPGVYPYWHPQGKYIAYSVNTTHQMFHSAADERIEVVDWASDIIVYDIENNTILSTPLLKTENFETFPSFSPDGKTLYFSCSTKQELPEDYKEIRYNLCKIDFNPENGSFGTKIDTLVWVDKDKKSISFARPSYDGKYIMYVLSDYGNFSIWHKEADLWLLNLQTGENRLLTEVNSPDTESYHSWSSNSRWFVFSSRRIDGLYTRPYIASIDENGKISKPFLLPQKNPDYYTESLYSFNIPEFVNGQVQLNLPELKKQLISKQRK